VAAASTADNYWFYWRVWFLSEAVAFVMLAPAVLTWIGGARAALAGVSLARCAEACVIGCGLLAICILVFNSSTEGGGRIPALVYLLLPLLLWAAVRFGAAGVNTSLPIVAPEVTTAAFRIAQEAVTNVLRHARAGNIWVRLTAGPSNLERSVRDDGLGFDLMALRRSPATSFGLSSMRERVRLVGGQIEIRTSPGAGTEVWARFPTASA
jgi:hypothetical protein